tara:strand:+ start:74 stop:430 length:357 start_codon:yes stop_codon:yes gene_type:complete
MYLALDKDTSDLILKEGGGIERVNKGRFVVQQVQSKLRTWLGEWVLDTSIGWLNQQDFEKDYNQGNIERRARVIILGTQGVLSIISIDSTYSKRKLTIDFKAKTIYGDIDVTIPWGTQ